MILLDPALGEPSPDSVAAFATLIDRAATFAALVAVYPGNRAAQRLSAYSVLMVPGTSIGTAAILMAAAYLGGHALVPLVPWVIAGGAIGVGTGVHLVSKTAAGRHFMATVPDRGRARGWATLEQALTERLGELVLNDPEFERLRDRFGDVPDQEIRQILPVGAAAAAGCARWLGGGDVGAPAIVTPAAG